MSVHLRVADLARSVDFYTRRLGLAVSRRNAAQAELAVAPGASPLLTLTGDPSAAPAPRDAAGLFHAALLFPSRAALGGWLRHALEHDVTFDGFSDHGVSEALYFSDPDGNGLEFYTDRPRDRWPFAHGELAMVTQPLDVDSLLAAGTPAGTTPAAEASWGHLHLRVTDLERSTAFYESALGLQVTQRSFPGARFLAADGYHHHLGLNTWGQPRRPQPSGALGLAGATFALAGVKAPRDLRDPDGLALRTTPA